MPFTPRTSITVPTAMAGNPWWYSNGNIFYAAGYGLPNCTCYSYGRVGEILGAFETRLPSGDAGTWYPTIQLNGALPIGSTPALGAVICWYDPNGVWAGHCAIVEEIRANGDLYCSNSGYPDNYFWMSTLTQASGYRENWMISRGYQFQGFIYCYDLPPAVKAEEDYYIIWLQGEGIGRWK